MNLTIQTLRQTKPWVRFMSVMMFIGAGFMVLAGAAIILAGAAGRMGSVGIVLGFTYVVMALIYIVPAIYLWMYADRIAVFMQSRSTGALASALEAQKSFWKFVGIFTLVVTVIYAAFIAFGFVAGALSSVR